MRLARGLLRAFAFISASTLAVPAAAASPAAPSLTARLGSCDPATVRSAAQEMLRDPQTLHEPLLLFHAASGMRMIGEREEAAFLLLLAGLRSSRQIVFVKGDRPQLLSVMMMTVGTLVMPDIESDPAFARRVVARVLEWDRANADPYRDRPEAQSAEIAKRLAAVEADITRLPDQLDGNPERVAKGKAARQEAEAMVKARLPELCGPGTLDAIDIEAALQRVLQEAVTFVRAHPFVLANADGGVKSANVSSYSSAPASRLPKRLTVGVGAASGRGFFAEVDALITITPERKLGAVQMSLACLTRLSIGSRDGRWRDVCENDPAALKPAP